MAARTGNQWTDGSWTPYAGCLPCSTGCRHCYVPLQAGTLHQRAGIHKAQRALYLGVTKQVNSRYVFNGKFTVLAAGDPSWRWPLEWEGAIAPVMGIGMPTLIFCSGGGDLFIEGRPLWVADQVIATLAASPHIGQLLNRRAELMADYFLPVPAETHDRWRHRLWLGTSAENQEWFDRRWPPMRELAQQGWTVFISVAPMIGPVRLPDDLLRFGKQVWVIASGEQRPGNRYMNPAWARAVRDQCREAGVAFFMKQLNARQPLPADLLTRQFPNPYDLKGEL